MNLNAGVEVSTGTTSSLRPTEIASGQADPSAQGSTVPADFRSSWQAMLEAMGGSTNEDAVGEATDPVHATSEGADLEGNASAVPAAIVRSPQQLPQSGSTDHATLQRMKSTPIAAIDITAAKGVIANPVKADGGTTGKTSKSKAEG